MQLFSANPLVPLCQRLQVQPTILTETPLGIIKDDQGIWRYTHDGAEAPEPEDDGEEGILRILTFYTFFWWITERYPNSNCGRLLLRKFRKYPCGRIGFGCWFCWVSCVGERLFGQTFLRFKMSCNAMARRHIYRSLYFVLRQAHFIHYVMRKFKFNSHVFAK